MTTIAFPNTTCRRVIAVVSFFIEFLQSTPATKAPHVDRRKGTPESFALYGWGLPIAKGAAQAIKV